MYMYVSVLACAATFFRVCFELLTLRPCLRVMQSVQTAVEECAAKHKGASLALYGKLRYILLVVVAGDQFGVYAMSLEQGSKPQLLVEHFGVRPCAHACGRAGVDTALLTTVTVDELRMSTCAHVATVQRLAMHVAKRFRISHWCTHCSC